MKNTMHTKNGVPRGLSGYLYVTGGKEKPDIKKYSVGDIVRWFHKRKKAGMDIFDGVVLGVSGDGATQELLVFDPACKEPEVINARKVYRLYFGSASDNLRAMSKATQYLKNSAKYFSH